MVGKLRPDEKRFFPPEVRDLQVWSTLFRSEGTWANYLSYVRTACMIVQVPTQVSMCCMCVLCDAEIWNVQVFKDPAVGRAKASIARARNFVKRERMFIRRF